MNVNGRELEELFGQFCPEARAIRSFVNRRGLSLFFEYGGEIERSSQYYFAGGVRDMAQANRIVKGWAEKFNGRHQRKAS